MPVKELLALSAIILAATYIANPFHPQQALRNLEIRILREARRTDDWGNPSIFKYESSKFKKSRSQNQHHFQHLKKPSSG